jgi:hypothetical protein
LSKRKFKRKRSKGLVLLLLPALIFIGFVGWLICALEPPNRKPVESYQAPKTQSSGDSVTFLPAAYGEQAEVKTN